MKSVRLYLQAQKSVRVKKISVIGFFILLFVGCASTKVGLYTNPPGAKVYSKPLGTGRFELLGETPIAVSGEQIEKKYSGSGPVLVEFRKEGFQTNTVLVTELSSQDLNINAEMVPLGGLEDSQRLNHLIDTLFECQRLVKVHRYEEALANLKDLEKQTPQVSIIYELQGGIFYLQQKYQDALDAYRLAVRYYPKNVEALRMRNLLEGKFGIERTPAENQNTESKGGP